MMKIVEYIANFPSLPKDLSKIDKFEFIRWNIAFFVVGLFYGAIPTAIVLFYLWT